MAFNNINTKNKAKIQIVTGKFHFSLLFALTVMQMLEGLEVFGIKVSRLPEPVVILLASSLSSYVILPVFWLFFQQKIHRVISFLIGGGGKSEGKKRYFKNFASKK